MALTPEDVVNQKFTITKFRDGYDLDQVDDFLDTIVEELRQHEQEKDELRKQIAELTEQLEASETKLNDADASKGESSEDTVDAAERTIVVDAPTPPALAAEESQTVAPANSNENDAKKSSAMLQLALELHDKHVREGEETRARLVGEGEETSRRLVQEAQVRRAEELRLLDGERKNVQLKIRELRDFEGEYRTTLRSYIQSQLRGLDGSPEPEGAPEGLA